MLKRIIALMLVAASLLGLTLLSGCGSGCGDIEDEVFIQKALEHFIATQNDSIWSSSSTGLVETQIQTYSSVDEFIEKNPNCCSFGYRGYEGELPSWWTRFQNDYAGIVFVSYVKRRIEGDSIVEVQRRTEYPMNSCAEPISRTKIWPR